MSSNNSLVGHPHLLLADYAQSPLETARGFLRILQPASKSSLVDFKSPGGKRSTSLNLFARKQRSSVRNASSSVRLPSRSSDCCLVGPCASQARNNSLASPLQARAPPLGSHSGGTTRNNRCLLADSGIAPEQSLADLRAPGHLCQALQLKKSLLPSHGSRIANEHPFPRSGHPEISSFYRPTRGLSWAHVGGNFLRHRPMEIS